MSTRAVSKPALPWTVLVLGGAGFIGRHAVEALLLRGHRVIIGTRDPVRHDRRLRGPLRRCERREVHLERLLRAGDWADALAGIDAVINCVGILRPRGRETYDRVHHLAPAALAHACHERGLRLVHVSALGLANGRSGFLRSKRRGERALLASPADAALVRPSLLDGEGGFGARWIRRVADWPLHPCPANARGRLAVMMVGDLGHCLARIALAPQGEFAPGRERVIELGGPDAVPLPRILQALRTRPGKTRTITVPSWLARCAAHVCDVLHVTPLSFGHYELLQRDNAPAYNQATRWLQRSPLAIDREPKKLLEQGVVLR